MNKKALSRIPLSKLMDLKIDYAFKQVFGSERNKNITVVFLNAVLKKTGRDTIKEVVFINSEFGGEYDGDKQSRLDIVVKTQRDEVINVEIQLSNQHDMLKRTMFYWSKLYTSQLQKGMAYYRLLPTITINICNFTVFNKLAKYHNTFHLYEDDSKERLDPEEDVLEIHFIEMNKFLQQWHAQQLNPLDDLLARWLLLLGMVDARKQKVYDQIYYELEDLAMKDENLLEAFHTWQELSMTQEEMLAYQSRLKFILDEEAKFDHARHEGQKIGREEGREEGQELAKEQIVLNGLKNNIGIDTLMVLTGLAAEEIEMIAKKMK